MTLCRKPSSSEAGRPPFRQCHSDAVCPVVSGANQHSREGCASLLPMVGHDVPHEILQFAIREADRHLGDFILVTLEARPTLLRQLLTEESLPLLHAGRKNGVARVYAPGPR